MCQLEGKHFFNWLIMRKTILSYVVISLSSINVFCQNDDKIKLDFFEGEIEKSAIIEYDIVNDDENTIKCFVGAEYLVDGAWREFISDFNNPQSKKNKLVFLEAKTKKREFHYIQDVFSKKNMYDYVKKFPLRLKLRYKILQKDSVWKVIHSEEFTLK